MQQDDNVSEVRAADSQHVSVHGNTLPCTHEQTKLSFLRRKLPLFRFIGKATHLEQGPVTHQHTRTHTQGEREKHSV